MSPCCRPLVVAERDQRRRSIHRLPIPSLAILSPFFCISFALLQLLQILSPTFPIQITSSIVTSVPAAFLPPVSRTHVPDDPSRPRGSAPRRIVPPCLPPHSTLCRACGRVLTSSRCPPGASVPGLMSGHLGEQRRDGWMCGWKSHHPLLQSRMGSHRE